MVSDFLQELHDWGEIWDDIEPGPRVQTAYTFYARIAKLESFGLWVFALRLPRPFGSAQKQVMLSIATVYIVRSTNSSIVKIGATDAALPAKFEALTQ